MPREEVCVAAKEEGAATHLQTKEFQGLPTAIGSRKRQGEPSPTGFRRSTALPPPRWWTSSFQNCEKTDFFCLSLPVCGSGLGQQQETNSIGRSAHPHGNTTLPEALSLNYHKSSHLTGLFSFIWLFFTIIVVLLGPLIFVSFYLYI